MSNMNQSFIRAFAKKDAALDARAASTTMTGKKPVRRPATEGTTAYEVLEPSQPKAQMKTTSVIAPISNLLHSESVFVYSTYLDEPATTGIATAVSSNPWTPQAAESAQAAVAEVPRSVAQKSTIPAAPKQVIEPHFDPLKTDVQQVVQRVDAAHQSCASLPPIHPSWEVDHLMWPRTCDQLLSEENAYFQETSSRLAEASKQGMRTLAVCASRRGEGCSTVALCIARAASAAGLRIAILDADAQSNGVADLLGLEFDCSWTAAVKNSESLDEHAIQVLDQPITVFPCSKSAEDQKSIRSSQSLALIPEIAKQYDLLIVDFGSMSEGALPIALMHEIELHAALVVRDLRHTSSREVHGTVNQLRQAGIEAVGIAENFGAR